MGDDFKSEPWAGVQIERDAPPMRDMGIDRRGPVDERTLDKVEVLSGARGPKLDHAVRFRDLDVIFGDLQRTMRDLSAPVFGDLSRQIQGQFQAIDSESKALLQFFNDAFDRTGENIETVKTELETTQDGLSTSITQLQQTANGIDAVYGIRINNNGHVSGFGLISQLRNGQPVSDFIISDASFRIVNSSGAGNYTPFAVYPTGRIVDGHAVPAGVHAQDLYVTRANISVAAIDTARIANAAITNAKIGNLEVDTIKIADGAISKVAVAQANGIFATANVSLSHSGTVSAVASFVQGTGKNGHIWRLYIAGQQVASAAPIEGTTGTLTGGRFLSAGNHTCYIQCDTSGGDAAAAITVFGLMK